jgi:hypothetical protein
MTRLLVPGSSVLSLRLIGVLLRGRAESPAFADRAFHVESYGIAGHATVTTVTRV